MPENGATLSPEAILQRIRREAARLERCQPDSEPQAPPRAPTLPRFSTIAPTPSQACHVADFLDLPPADFVRAAYLTLLGREPDAEGLAHYQPMVDAEPTSRLSVLARIARSAEARQRGAKVRHLWPLTGFFLLGRIRFLGPVAQCLVAPFFSPFLAQLAARPRTRPFTELDRLAEEGNTALAEAESALKDCHAGQHHLRDNEIETLFQDVGALEEALKAQDQRSLGQVQRLRRDVVDAQRRLQILLERTSVQPAQSPPPSEEGHPALDALFMTFEDEFRGSRQEIKTGLSVYLPLVEAVRAQCGEKPVYDLGCGRGEWLELLREWGIEGTGVDLNAVCVRECHDHGLNALHAEALAALRDLPDGTLACVSAFHLIEHLPLEMLIALMDEALRVLAPGGLLLFETPNPRNILVGSGDFYRDPSHRNPVFPDTLAFIGEQRGFTPSSIAFFDTDRSRLLPAAETTFETLQDYIDVSRDYAWTGYKACV